MGNLADKESEVNKFHENSDVDSSKLSQHHTLGSAPNQASPGNHSHDGGSSKALLAGTTLTGSRAADAWRLQINAALVKLGAVDSTTA